MCLVAAPGRAEACFTLDRPVSDAEMDEYSRQVVDRLEELFEAEVISTRGPVWEMRVTRVHRGGLREGMILRGPPDRDECDDRVLKAGDRGFVWISFGPNGPRFVGRFIEERRVESLRRIGALPSRRASRGRVWRSRARRPR